MAKSIEVADYCDALLIWAKAASRPPQVALVRAGCDAIRLMEPHTAPLSG